MDKHAKICPNVWSKRVKTLKLFSQCSCYVNFKTAVIQFVIFLVKKGSNVCSTFNTKLLYFNSIERVKLLSNQKFTWHKLLAMHVTIEKLNIKCKIKIIV